MNRYSKPRTLGAAGRSFPLLPTNDKVDGFLALQDFAPMIRGENAAVDDTNLRARRFYRPRDGVEPECPNKSACGSYSQTAARICQIDIGPNSASTNLTRCPASRSDPPSASKPSGGRCSCGIRLPIAGCGEFRRRTRIYTLYYKVYDIAAC